MGTNLGTAGAEMVDSAAVVAEAEAVVTPQAARADQVLGLVDRVALEVLAEEVSVAIRQPGRSSRKQCKNTWRSRT
jgi:hypothetical protein